MTNARALLASLAALALSACTPGETSDPPNDALPTNGSNPAAGTRPSGQPNLATYEGIVEEGVECRVLRTATGERWAFNSDADIKVGDHVAITGDVADASFCQEGQGTLIVESIAVIDPPAGH